MVEFTSSLQKLVLIKGDVKMKEYEVIGKNMDDDWETIKWGIKTKKQAMTIAKKQDKAKWQIIDINLIVDDDLKETYDKNGKVR